MQKKSEIFKKRNFLGQALDFLPPRKPGLYISRVDFFFFEYHEFTKKAQSLSCLIVLLFFFQRTKHCDLHRCEKILS